MAAVSPEQYGPYNGNFLRGGIGLTKPLPAADPLFGPEAKWTLSAWVEMQPGEPQDVVLAGLGLPADADTRLFLLDAGKPALRLSSRHVLRGAAPLTAGWHLLAATYAGGTVRFFVDGVQTATDALHAGTVSSAFQMAPVQTGCGQLVCSHFGGRIAELSLRPLDLTPAAVAAMFQSPSRLRADPVRGWVQALAHPDHSVRRQHRAAGPFHHAATEGSLQ